MNEQSNRSDGVADRPAAFVLLSGGIDSAVCLEWALDRYEDVTAIHVDYGQQTGSIEQRNARSQADEHGIRLHVLEYRAIFGAFAEGTVRDQHYDREEQAMAGHSVGYVPQRNLHFLVSGAALAEHHTDTGRPIHIVIGAQGGDRADYPDCRPAFVAAAQEAIQQSTDQHDIRVEAPLIDRSKTEVLELGSELGVDWERTFSCYNDQSGTPCLECPACRERIEAFEAAGLVDPLLE